MVLKDAELDELWRALGSYRGKIREHLEAATETEATIASMVPERLFREYRDLKADYEHDHEALGMLQADYRKRIAELQGARSQLQVYERDMSHLISDIATFNIDQKSIGGRITSIRDKIRTDLRAMGYKGNF
ncbi:MAG: hypothetical protein Q8P40_04900 [Nitrospirota bacterium]|nr:hypothetical protein [Nitrospirota bacterium]